MEEENWYKILNSKQPLSQGDIFFNCPIVKPDYAAPDGTGTPQLNAKIDEYTVIILSQSCDLINNKLDIVLVSPIFTLSKFIEFDPSFAARKKKNKLREEYFPPYHLLNKPINKGVTRDFFVVDFHSVFGSPFDFLNKLREKQRKRLTLKSPYKEHLSQAFARYVMRVGLPSTIPEFTT